MPIVNTRDYRTVKELEVRKAEEGKESFVVEGYATTFDDPYVLYNYDGVDYLEQVDRNAFDGCDMSDVIFQYDHSGMVYARQKNGTLQLSVDEHGLKVVADLGSTEESRKIYEAIKAGLISEMSFAFTVEEDKYDNKNHLRTITRIKKLYDVSCVSIPANPDTDIAARTFVEGVLAKEAEEFRLAEERQARIDAIKKKLGE